MTRRKTQEEGLVYLKTRLCASSCADRVKTTFEKKERREPAERTITSK